MKKQLLRQIMLTSLLAAMAAVMTYFIKIPTHSGYIHVGDSVIYIAACLLPTPLAMLCGAIGGMFADLLGGYTAYILPSIIIKALIAAVMSNKSTKTLTKRNALGCACGGAITVVGYYIAEAAILSLSSSTGLEQFKSSFFSPVVWSASLYTIPGNIIQAVASTAVFLLLGSALDKINIKSRI